MAVIRQANFLGQQRVDLSHIRAVESAITNDFDILAGKILANKKPLVVRGFNISTAGTIGTAASSLQLNVASGALLHYGASESGTIFAVPDGTAAEILSSANAKVSGSFTAGVTNYIGIDLLRSADTSTSDLVQFYDPSIKQEVGQTVPLARILNYKIIISTQSFTASSNICPVAKVLTDSSNNVVSITDARPMMFRLGTGGDTANALAGYTWGTRTENNIVFSGGNDSFTGEDKSILGLKGWMDAVMTSLWETRGGEYWYSNTSRDNIKLIFGQPVMVGTGDNFSYNSGTGVLSWQSLSIAFENSTAYYNTIQDGSATLSADGQCLYVDLQRSTNGAVLVPTVATLMTVGSPLIPGSRVIWAWRQGGLIFIRDRNFEVGRATVTATSAALGVVKLSTIGATTPTATVLSETIINDALGVPQLDSHKTLQLNGNSGFPGLNATSAGGNVSAITATGSGTGSGVSGTGGSGGGSGVSGQGTGAGSGVSGTGGGSDGTGVSGQGTGQGSGVLGTGGTTNGTGVYGIGGTTNGIGVKGQGKGTGAGVQGSSLSGNAVGVEGIGSTGQAGVWGHGSGIAGVQGDAGSSGGPGVLGQSSSADVGVHGFTNTAQAGVLGRSTSTGSGGKFINTGGGYGLEVGTGYIGLTGLNTNTAGKNVVTPSNVCKAWAHITVTGGVATVDDGFNIAGAVCSGTGTSSQMVITFNNAFASTNFTTSGTCSNAYFPYGTPSSTTTFTFKLWNPVANTNIDFSTTNVAHIQLMFFGNQ